MSTGPVPWLTVESKLLMAVMITVLSLGSWYQGAVMILAYIVLSMPIRPREVRPLETYTVIVKICEAL